MPEYNRHVNHMHNELSDTYIYQYRFPEFEIQINSISMTKFSGVSDKMIHEVICIFNLGLVK